MQGTGYGGKEAVYSVNNRQGRLLVVTSKESFQEEKTSKEGTREKVRDFSVVMIN